MKRKQMLMIVLAMLVATIAIYYVISRPAPKTENEQNVFISQEECEQKTGTTCDYKMCDYIPEGKTVDEVCGKNFKKGWVPVTFVCPAQPKGLLYNDYGLINEPENTYTGILEAVPGLPPGVSSSLMRELPYRLNGMDVDTRENLSDFVGKRVTITGKNTRFELEGTQRNELKPISIRCAD